jgi:hypothetical protein
LPFHHLGLVKLVQLEARIIRCQGPRSYPGCNWHRDHLLLLIRLALLSVPALLVLLLISRPG